MTATPQRKRILLLGDGRQVHTARWGDYLEADGYEVLTLSLEPLTAVTGTSKRIRITEALPDFLRYPLAVPPVKRVALDFKPDAVSAHFLPNYGVIAALAGFENWVLSAWGSDIMLLPDKSAFQMWRTRRVLERATHITSDAEVMTARLAELGVARERILTFPFGVDRTIFSPGTPSRGDAPRILSNRKLEAVYDIACIIDAFADVHARVPEATLTVAGGGSLEHDLRGRAGAGVNFAGDLPHDQIPGLLRAHDLYVSMTHSDTTSVSLLEAMACGLYPIVSDIAANREWIEPGVNGALVPVGDSARLATAIFDTWRDEAAIARARETNRRLIAERADWTDNMRVVRDLFARLTGRHSIPA